MKDVLAALAILFYGLSAVYYALKFFLKKDKTALPAFLFLLIGVITHGLDLLVIGLSYRHFPASTLSEAFSLVSWLTIVLFIFILKRGSMEALAVTLLPIGILAILLHELAGVPDPATVPVLKGEWIFLHIPLMILSVASLTLTFVLAIMYLIQERQLKSKQPAFFYYRLPSLEVCEDLAFKSLWFGYFLLTLGIVTGMIHSKNVHGAYWSWDYKEVWALITWILYSIIMHGRMLAAWRGRKAAYLAIVGFALMLFSFAGVSFIFKSYHAF